MVEKANIKHSPVNLAIVGGGAAGLFAASVAADRGVGCLVFERKARVGSKMLMTANGRCNFTKDISPERMLADIGEPVASFVERAVKECPPSRILSGFRSSLCPPVFYCGSFVSCGRRMPPIPSM